MPEQQRQRRIAWGYALGAGLAIVGMVALLIAPASLSASFLSPRMLSLHLVLELFAIVIAVLVVLVTAYTFDEARSPAASVLGAGFLVVACCDLMHALTYEGMPAFVTDSSTERAIFFWLMGRSFEVGTMALVALKFAPRLGPRSALTLGAVVAAGVVWWGSVHIGAFPVTFVQGLGVTPFKAGFEVVLCGANLAVAALLARQAMRHRAPQYRLLAMSSFVMGIGELAFTSYLQPSDFQNIAGHLYKLVAYGLLFRAVFINSIRAPYEAVRASEARLRESETRARTLSDNLPQSIVYQSTFDEDGLPRFLQLSRALERLLGLKVDAVLGNAALFYERIHHDDVALMAAASRQASEAMQVFRVQVRMHRADGTLRHMEFLSAPRWLDDGRLVWDGLVTDITEREDAHEGRRLLESQLREAQKMESIGTLASGIAHDFNNLIGSIMGNIALARDDARNGHKDDLLASLEQIHRAGQRARELVRQILTFGHRQPSTQSVVALRPIVEDTLGLLRATLPAHVAVEAHFATEPLHVMADTSQIGQVVLNLCTNAWQALGDAVGRISVEVDRAELAGEAALKLGLAPGAYVRLGVADNGCGMSEETRQRLFEPFFTTKPAGTGTGLGLSVVHGIVRSHDGAVEVTSRPGHGTRFDIYLPQASAAAPGVAAGPAPAPEATRRGHGERVLYLDDDEVMCLMVERLLARAGYRVVAYQDPAQALQAVATDPEGFDLVVTDYNMPTQSGLDVVRALRSMQPGLPTILTTGCITDELATRAAALGVSRLLEKQNSLEELAAAVHRALSNAHAQAEVS